MAAVYSAAVVEIGRSRAIAKYTKAVVEFNRLDATHLNQIAERPAVYCCQEGVENLRRLGQLLKRLNAGNGPV